MSGRTVARLLVVPWLLAGLPECLWAQATATPPRKATVCFGVYTQCYRLPEALPDCGLTICNAKSNGVENFPAPEALNQQAVLILSDVSGREFSAEQIAQVRAYVEQGGGLLVLGGPFSLGLGAFKETHVAEWLPVDIESPDLKWEKAGVPLAPVAGSALAAGLDFAAQPKVCWIHRVTPKAEATVHLQAGPYPVLVTGRFGKGKVAVFTGTPLGVLPAGQTPFWEWKGWPTLLQNTVNWLAAREG